MKRPGSMMAAYSWALDDALRKHGIEIPFPQQDLRIRSFFGAEDKAGLSAWRGDRTQPERKAPEPDAAPHPSINDAAREIAQGQEEKTREATAEGIRETAAMMDKARKATIESADKD